MASSEPIKYRVGTGSVRLSVTIGEGQFGTILVQVGDKLYPVQAGFSEAIGDGSELVGTRIQVFSRVNDTNTQTNRTSVTYKLEGGAEPFELTQSSLVEQERDRVKYKAVFELIAAEP